MPDFEESIRGLSPGALKIFKQQLPTRLKSMSETERTSVMSRLSNMPELRDVLAPEISSPSGKVTQKGKPLATEYYGDSDLAPWEMPKDMPLWQKSIRGVSAVPETAQQFGVTPLMAMASQPVWKEKWLATLTPAERTKYNQMSLWDKIGSFFPEGNTQGVEGYNWWSPPQGVKFAMETLPWLAIPNVAVGKGATLAKGAAKISPKLGAAVKYSPWGLQELAASSVLGQAGKGVSKLLGKAGTEVAGEIGGLAGKAGGETAEEVSSILANNPALKVEAEAPKGMIEKLKGIGNSVGLRRKVIEKEKTAELAKRIGKAEGLMKSAPEGQKLGAFMSVLQNPLTDYSFTPLGQFLSQKERNIIESMVTEYPFVNKFNRANVINGLRKLLDEGKIPEESEQKMLDILFPGFTDTIISKLPLSTTQKIVEPLNALKSLASGFDISGGIRPGGVLLSRHPSMIPGALKTALKTLYSESASETVNDVILSRPHSQEFMERAAQQGYDGFLTLGGRLSKRAEGFTSNLIKEVPVLGSIIKGSERSYISVINDIVSRSWEMGYDTLQKAGATDVDFNEFAKFLSLASGRGKLPKQLASSASIWNAVLFAPKRIASQLQLPTMLRSPSPIVRKEAARTLVQWLGTGATILSLAKLAGAEINTDPRSSDFGKMKIGDTRIDIWSGYSTWVKFTAQLATGERKTSGGDVIKTNRKELVDRLVRGKFSPGFGLLADILGGETYMGEEVNLDTQNIQREAFNKLFPLVVQDMIDAIDQQGGVGAMAAFSGFFGADVVTYLSPSQKVREEEAQTKYGMGWDDLGKQPDGALKQKEITQSERYVKVAEKEQGEQVKTIGKKEPSTMYYNQTRVIENNYKKGIEDASRYLNDKQDGVGYREMVMDAAKNRRAQYDALKLNPDYAEVTSKFTEPLTQKEISKMNPQEVARIAYNRMVYSDEVYDEYGQYDFNKADMAKEMFVQQFGEQALTYVEAMQGVKEEAMPVEYRMLKQAQRSLQPYWEIENQIWSQYPPELKQKSEEINIIARTNPQMEKQMLFQYPNIVYIRKAIAQYRKQMLNQNPQMKQLLGMFYG